MGYEKLMNLERIEQAEELEQIAEAIENLFDAEPGSEEEEAYKKIVLLVREYAARLD